MAGCSTLDLVPPLVLHPVVHGHAECDEESERLEREVDDAAFVELGSFDRWEAGDVSEGGGDIYVLRPSKRDGVWGRHLQEGSGDGQALTDGVLVMSVLVPCVYHSRQSVLTSIPREVAR